MIANASTCMLTLDQVADRLGVGKRSVEEWVKARVIASVKFGNCRRISEEALCRFVLANTVNPQRPDWLTAEVQGEFERKIAEIVDQRLQALVPMRLLAV